MAQLVAIVGGSGSGKSTLAEALLRALPAGRAVLVSEDWYYGDHGAKPGFDAARFDFDDVAARDHDQLLADLRTLKAGQPIQAPTYSFVHHRRLAETTAIAAAELVIVEGAHLFCTPALVEAFDLRVFVDTPPDIRFIRRLLRDRVERGRPSESVISQYLATVRPAHLRLIEPSRAVADIVIADEGGEVQDADPAELQRLLRPLLLNPALRQDDRRTDALRTLTGQTS